MRVRIIGDHPWANYTGIVLDEPPIQILGTGPLMLKVRLDGGEMCEPGHECFASRENLQVISKAGICDHCGRQMRHYRLKGYRCPYCSR